MRGFGGIDGYGTQRCRGKRHAEFVGVLGRGGFAHHRFECLGHLQPGGDGLDVELHTVNHLPNTGRDMRTPQQQTAGDGYVLALAEHLLVTLAVVAGIERTAGDVQLAELVFLLRSAACPPKGQAPPAAPRSSYRYLSFHHIVV